MERPTALILALFLCGTGELVYGQSLLKSLEERLQKGVAAVTSGAEAAPGTGYLGAVLDDAEQPGRGVRVTSVRPGAPADQGGLKTGDVITTIDAKAITRMEDLDAVLNKAVPGQKLRLMVERGSQKQSLTIQLGARPAPAAASEPGAVEAPGATAPPAPTPALTNPTDPTPATPSLGAPALTAPSTSSSPPSTTPAAPLPSLSTPSSSAPGTIRSRPLDPGPTPSEPATTRPGALDSLPSTTPTPAPGASSPTPGGGASLGIMVDELTEAARSAYGLSVRRGALITSVRPDSPADRAGLPVGGVVVAFDGRRIDSADDLVAAIKGARSGQEVELGYYQGDRFARKSVRLGASGSASSGGAMPSPVAPLRPGPLGLGLGAGSPDRPLLSRVERMVDSLAPKPASTVYNPSEMAALNESVIKLSEQVRKLEERLNAIESKSSSSSGGSSVPPPAPAPGAFTPGNP